MAEGEGGLRRRRTAALLVAPEPPGVPAPVGGRHDLPARRLGRAPRPHRPRARAHRFAGLGRGRHRGLPRGLRRHRPGAGHVRGPLRAHHRDARGGRRSGRACSWPCCSTSPSGCCSSSPSSRVSPRLRSRRPGPPRCPTWSRRTATGTRSRSPACRCSSRSCWATPSVACSSRSWIPSRPWPSTPAASSCPPLLLLGLRNSAAARPASVRSTVVRSLGDGAAMLFGDRMVRRALVFVSVTGALGTVDEALVVPYSDHIGLPDGLLGLLAASIPVGTLVATAIIAGGRRDHHSLLRTAAWCGVDHLRPRGPAVLVRGERHPRLRRLRHLGRHVRGVDPHQRRDRAAPHARHAGVGHGDRGRRAHGQPGPRRRPRRHRRERGGLARMRSAGRWPRRRSTACGPWRRPPWTPSTSRSAVGPRRLVVPIVAVEPLAGARHRRRPRGDGDGGPSRRAAGGRAPVNHRAGACVSPAMTTPARIAPAAPPRDAGRGAPPHRCRVRVG